MDYMPGALLNEQSLADEFGISRTPIRVVLNRLEWEGLVRTIPRKGTLATEIDFRQIQNAFRVRMEIECLIGTLAAENITQDHLKKIDDLVVRCEKLIGRYNRRALISVDVDLRSVLHDAANNDVLKNISNQLWSLTLRVWIAVCKTNDWNFEIEDTLREIRETRRALAESDPETVGVLRQGYLQDFLNRIKNQF